MLCEAKRLWLKRAASTVLPRSKAGVVAAVVALVLLVTTIFLWDDLDGVFERHAPVPELSIWPQPANNPHPSLAVIIPITKHTDTRFYRNMWMGNHEFTICETRVADCSMVCGQPGQTTAQADVDCLVRAAKNRFNETEFIVRMSDDMLVDRSYVYGIMEEYKAIDVPMYISSTEQANTSGSVESGFYMFNRALTKCISDKGTFEERVAAGCGSAKRVDIDATKMWQGSYTSRNKHINLAAKGKS
ncbi:hypothetical protein GGF49_001495 [Coemansia sp. RSA 1853]|nr:hypothetical protein LPJ76_000627 [Coemansia sp. RSA 638]KAJ2544123.1 hypothetical protein GGF49_001495 [Coemansia sp. RSA 1853]